MPPHTHTYTPLSRNNFVLWVKPLYIIFQGWGSNPLNHPPPPPPPDPVVTEHTLCRCITLKDTRVTTSYMPWTTPLVTVVRKSYTHARNCLPLLTVPKSEAENSNFSKLPRDVQGNGQFTTDSQVA